MKSRVKTNLLMLYLLNSVSLLLLISSSTANAVPSFARQTNMPCSSCHSVFPELNSFGREFKLNGYTFTGLQQIQQSASGQSGEVNISEIPPLSAMLLVGASHVNKAAADTQNNDIQFPDQLSFFYAGEITPHIGSFIQITYTQADGQFGWDNTDIRYANRTQLGGADTIYGVTLNNNPTVEDPWNSTPAWGFPFVGSSTAAEPTAAALVDGTLGQDVIGLGAYTLWNGHLYVNLSLYQSSHQGQGASDASSSNTLDGVAPYWRLAWQQDTGKNTLMIGTYGMTGKLYPAGISGPTDDYTDNAIDAQYEMPLGNNLLSLHTTYLHEEQTLNATDSGADHELDVFRLNGIYHWSNQATLSLGYFDTSGDENSALWGTASGKPDTTGWLTQLSYLPWQNTKFSLQYTGYSNFDGSGDSPSDNDTTYLSGWFMW